MQKKKKQNNKGGFIVSTELILIATILVLGLIVGLVSLRNQVTAELEDVAEAIGNIDQSFDYVGLIEKANGSTTWCAQVAGSAWADTEDTSLGDEVFITKIFGTFAGDSSSNDAP